MTLTSATTLYSCGLACIESILTDCGVPKTQVEMLELLCPFFPKWEEFPGLLSGADFEAVFREVGFPVTVLVPATFNESIELLSAPEAVGGILATSKFWADSSKQSLIELNHALRLVTADKNGVHLMNPYRFPATGRLEQYNWEEVHAFQTQSFIFHKVAHEV
jgi:hypothetical protein